jgi:hypothetical protein
VSEAPPWRVLPDSSIRAPPHRPPGNKIDKEIATMSPDAPAAPSNVGAATPGPLPRRFWIESVLSALTGFLFLLTLVWKSWIETIFGVDPDHGSGTAEWIAVAVLGAVTLALILSARGEWHAAHQSASVSAR